MEFSNSINFASLTEALEYCQQLKETRSVLFRGQGGLWPLRSSYLRLEDDQKENAKIRIEAFYEHFKLKIANVDHEINIHEVFAIAQHYGFPTNYIDFTTNYHVAAYFATNNQGLKKGDFVNILILDVPIFKEELNFFQSWSIEHQKEGYHPELIKIDVKNLWRLQAQEGLFLYVPFKEFESQFNLKRLQFPFDTPYDNLLHKNIYPDRKSHLEIELDKYFMAESIRRRNKEIFKAIPNTINIPHLNKVTVPEHNSWGESTRKHINETWQTVQTSESLTIEVDRNLAVSMEQLQKSFLEITKNRSKIITFNITDKIYDQYPENVSRLNRWLTETWDGIRNQDYSDEEIADCLYTIFNMANFIAAVPDNELPFFEWKNILFLYFLDTIEIEYGENDLSYARAFVSESSLKAAIREDLRQFLNDESNELYLKGDVYNLMLYIYQPNKLFDFYKLKKIFISEVIPTQALYGDKRAKFYNISSIKTFNPI